MMYEKKHAGEFEDTVEYVKTPLKKVEDPIGVAGFSKRFEESLPPEDRLPGEYGNRMPKKVFNSDPLYDKRF